MGLFDAFRTKPDALLESMKQAYGLQPAPPGDDVYAWWGRAHGRKLGVRAPLPGMAKQERFFVLLPDGVAGDSVGQSFSFWRPPAERLAVMPTFQDADWRERLEETHGVRMASGFALDIELDVDSPLLRQYGALFPSYLERFSPSTLDVVFELPWAILKVDPQQATPQTLRRDLECTDVFLRFFEERRFADGKDLWRHSGAEES
jgi:hypothetical protein